MSPSTAVASDTVSVGVTASARMTTRPNRLAGRAASSVALVARVATTSNTSSASTAASPRTVNVTVADVCPGLMVTRFWAAT